MFTQGYLAQKVLVHRDGPESRTSRHTFVLVAAVATTAGFWYGLAETRGPLRRSEITVESSSLHLGTVWAQSALKWKLPLRNSSDEDVTVVDIAASCPCASIVPRALRLSAGVAASVELTLDLLRVSAKVGAANVPFKINVRAKVRRAGVVETDQWSLDGTTRYSITVPKTVIFDGADRLRHGSAFPSTTIPLRAHVDLRELIAKSESPFAELAVDRNPDDLRDFAILLSLARSMPIGEFEFDVVLVSVLADGTELPPVPVRVLGVVEADIHAVPESVAIRPRRRGRTGREAVVLQSYSGTPFTVDHVRVSGVFADCRIVPRARELGTDDLRETHEYDIVPRSAFDSAEDNGDITFYCKTKAGDRHVVVVPAQIAYYD